MIRVHLLGVPHTVTRGDFSHCAFTGKVLRWSPMMKPRGVHVIHYGVEGSESGANEDVVLMDQAEHQSLLGHAYHEQGNGFYGDDATENNAVYRQWNYYAREELKQRVQPGDLIALPFGHAHDAAIMNLPQLLDKSAGAFELGIGYTDCSVPWRIYESHAVRHITMTKESRVGVTHDSKRLEFVIPNYYNAADWAYNARGGSDIVFLGRINEAKGVSILPTLARLRPNQRFVMCGQGDPSPYLSDDLPNLVYLSPLTGKARAEYLGNAKALIAPSRYAEPFCGVVAEAAFCGTPAITSDFGAFVETIDDGVTGMRCQTQEDWLNAIDFSHLMARRAVRDRALRLWDSHNVSHQYLSALITMTSRLRINASAS